MISVSHGLQIMTITFKRVNSKLAVISSSLNLEFGKIKKHISTFHLSSMITIYLFLRYVRVGHST